MITQISIEKELLEKKTVIVSGKQYNVFKTEEKKHTEN